MGNTLITSLCRREEVVDFEDISDATFDFISVAVHKDAIDAAAKAKTTRSAKTHKVLPKTSSDSVNKIVAVVPVALEPSLSSRSIVGCPTPTCSDDEESMSYNDRLNLLTWDPETTPLPTPFKHQELYVFDEYSSLPTNQLTPTNSPRAKRGWIRRAVERYSETKIRRREANQLRRQRLAREAEALPTPRQTKTNKRSLGLTLWGARDRQSKSKPTKEEPYQLPLMSSMSSILDEDDEEQRFLYNEDIPAPQPPANVERQELLKSAKKSDDEELLSDTESDDSSYSDATTLCRFYARLDGEEVATSDEDVDDDDSESEFSDWTRSTSTSSCYFSAAEEDAEANDENSTFFTSPVALCLTLEDHLCTCGDCSSYMTIEREVTNSNSWMNETERRALCRMLQAYSSLKPKTPFHKDMIAAAEECLLVFQGEENAAFNAFVVLAQSKW